MDTEVKNTSENICLKIRSTKKERYLLPFTSLVLLFIDESIRKNTSSFISILFFSLICLFINFPVLVTWTKSKPIYIEELFVDSGKIPLIKLDDETKQTYKKIYDYILILTNSILVSLLSNYWFYKTETEKSFYEIMGVTGGILQIFHLLNIMTGTITLFTIKYYIKNRIHDNISDSTEDSDFDKQIEGKVLFKKEHSNSPIFNEDNL